MWTVTEVAGVKGRYEVSKGAVRLQFVHHPDVLNCEPLCTSHKDQSTREVRDARNALVDFLRTRLFGVAS